MRKMTILACLALAGCDSSYTLNQSEQSTAKLGGMEYAQAAGRTFVSCSGQDSTADGYVTCKVKTPENVIEDVQCGYKSPGCK